MALFPIVLYLVFLGFQWLLLLLHFLLLLFVLIQVFLDYVTQLFQEFKCHLNAADLGLKSRLSAPLGCRFHSSVPLGHPSDMSNLTCLPLSHAHTQPQAYALPLSHSTTEPGQAPEGCGGHLPLSCCGRLNLLGKHSSFTLTSHPCHSVFLGIGIEPHTNGPGMTF